MNETCGYCSGRGTILSRPYDRYGAAQEQRSIVCEYCDGTGGVRGRGEVAPGREADGPGRTRG